MRFSIIIPAWNDTDALSRTLDYLDGLTRINEAEVIVAVWGNLEAMERGVEGRARLLRPEHCTRAALMNGGGG